MTPPVSRLVAENERETGSLSTEGLEIKCSSSAMPSYSKKKRKMKERREGGREGGKERRRQRKRNRDEFRVFLIT